MRTHRLGVILLLTVLAGPTLAGQARQTPPSAVPGQPARTPAPFTVDRVLEQLRSTFPEAARVADDLPSGVIAQEDLTYVRRGTRDLQLDLYRPVGAGLHPAVLVIHGGGWETGDRIMERPFAKQLAARGFVTAPVSYRLGSEGRFPGAIHDLKAAVRWLRANAARFHIDIGRIGAIGGSAGGHLATLLGATNGMDEFEGEIDGSGQTSAVQAVVDIDGAVTFVDNALIAQEERTEGAPSRFLGGTYSTRRATWYAASPLTYVGRGSAPCLFIKSTAPTPILPGREEMAARLRALGIDAEIVQMPTTPHPFWLVHPWFERTLADVDRFLRRHLMPH